MSARREEKQQSKQRKIILKQQIGNKQNNNKKKEEMDAWSQVVKNQSICRKQRIEVRGENKRLEEKAADCLDIES